MDPAYDFAYFTISRFAFGAALGPTDAVAVGSLSGRIDIPERSMNILSGEGLINDASGVTAFNLR